MEKNLIKTTLIIICIITVVQYSHSLLVMNNITCVFPDGQEKTLIENNVIDGSECYLRALSFANLVCVEFEKSAKQELDFNQSIELAGKAISELEEAIEKYSDAKVIAVKIGYNQLKREMFTSYNYDTLIQNYNFNMEIAGVVKNYLKSFDVIGIYQHNIDNLKGILTTINTIRENLNSATKPNVNIYWNLIQQFSEATLFSNYATIMGSSVLQKCDD